MHQYRLFFFSKKSPREKSKNRWFQDSIELKRSSSSRKILFSSNFIICLFYFYQYYQQASSPINSKIITFSIIANKPYVRCMRSDVSYKQISIKFIHTSTRYATVWMNVIDIWYGVTKEYRDRM